MNKIFVSALMILFLSSCDPDVPGEGITLPTMEFGIKVYPDTSHVKLGDTLIIFTSIFSTLENNIKIMDGKAAIGFGNSLYPTVPIVDKDERVQSKAGIEFDYIMVDGDIEISSSTGMILDVYAIPEGDSIIWCMKFIPLKLGTHILTLSSKFYEGSEGKTRTDPYFDMEDRHWDLWQDPEYPALTPGEYGYNTKYLFAVYE